MKTTAVESEFAKVEKHKYGETADVATRDKEKDTVMRFFIFHPNLWQIYRSSLL